MSDRRPLLEPPEPDMYTPPGGGAAMLLPVAAALFVFTFLFLLRLAVS